MGTGKKASGSRAKLIKTVISAVLVVAMIAMIAAANYFIPSNSSTVESVLGIASKGIDNSNAKTEGLDLDYTKPSYATQEDLAAYQKELDRQIAGEGVEDKNLEILARPSYENLCRFVMEYADGIVSASPNVDARVLEIARASGKPMLEYQSPEAEDFFANYNRFYEELQ